LKDQLINLLIKLPAQPTFWATGCAWLSACFLKVLILRIRKGKFHWERFFGTGGMPSSHMAFASGLTCAVGLSEGFESAVFGLALGLTILTGVDATGLRKNAGLQAERINQIVAELFKDQHVQPKKLRETLGHTTWEVIAGSVVGALVVFLLYPSKP
jgi:acid phosphatase family membrane protein YuiD